MGASAQQAGAGLICRMRIRKRMVKVISLSEQAYRELKKNKVEGESFSDVVLKMSRGKRGSIAGFIGAWEGDDLGRIEETLKRERQSVRSKEPSF